MGNKVQSGAEHGASREGNESVNTWDISPYGYRGRLPALSTGLGT